MKISEESTQVTIHQGICHIFYAYDIGMSIDLVLCQKNLSIAGVAASSNRNRRAPKCFDFDPLPLTFNRECSLNLGEKYQLLPAIAVTVYDFGAVSISYQIPCPSTLDGLRDLSVWLDLNETLLADSKQQAVELTELLGKAIKNPAVAAMVEDYIIFIIDDFSSTHPADSLPEHTGQILAQVLRAENAPLSQQEIDDALSCRIAYNPDDITLIDWNAAIIFDSHAEDIRAVLEFANVELLELRFLDRQLDTSLDRSYDLSTLASSLLQWMPGWRSHKLKQISQMQLESAILFERVSNAPKLLGDQFLARVYRLVAQRFHLNEWNTGILRKLETLEDIYTQNHDRAEGLRMEVLEWIIIILIAMEIVIPFFPKLLPGH